MNKYSDKSDFEINKAVAGILKLNTIAYDRTEIVLFDDMDATPFDPCNNPADAFPLILESRISIILPGIKYDDGYSASYAASGFDEDTGGEMVTDIEIFNENPLRAAMEVFLMMKDAENAKV